MHRCLREIKRCAFGGGGGGEGGVMTLHALAACTVKLTISLSQSDLSATSAACLAIFQEFSPIPYPLSMKIKTCLGLGLTVTAYMGLKIKRNNSKHLTTQTYGYIDQT